MRFHRFFLAATLLFPLFSTIATPGQAPQRESEAQPVIRAQANLVLVDVVVTDHGKPVPGLDQAKFHIYEEGKEESIFSFDEHRPPSAPAAQPVEQLPPGTYTNLPAYPEQRAVNVLLLDALNTPLGDQLRVRQQMIQYLKKIDPGTTLAVFTLSSRLRMISGFTSDVARLANLMNRPKTATPEPMLLETQTGAQQTTDVQTAVAQSMPVTPPPVANTGENGMTTGPMGAAAALAQFQADTFTAQTDIRVHITLDALDELAVYLSGIPGRKNLIWISGSFPLSILPDSTQYSAFRAIADYRDQIEKTTNLLTRARVAVYPIDARGLRVPSTFSVANNGVPGTSQLMAEKQQMYQEQGSLDEVAEQTGGHAYYDDDDLQEDVANAIEDGEHYYTIGYVPATAALNGEFRKIKVTVAGHDYKLFYRRGYYSDSPGKVSKQGLPAMNPMVAAALHGAPPATQIVFKAGLLAGSDPRLNGVNLPPGPAGEMAERVTKPARYVVNLTLNPRSFSFDTLPDGTRQGKIELLLIAYDEGGNLVNYLDKPLALGLKPEQYERIAAKGITMLVPLDLPAGEDSLRIAVEDLNDNRTGSMEIPITVGKS